MQALPQLLTWVLRLCTQVLLLLQQALYPPSHLLNPLLTFLMLKSAWEEHGLPDLSLQDTLFPP